MVARLVDRRKRQCEPPGFSRLNALTCRAIRIRQPTWSYSLPIGQVSGHFLLEWLLLSREAVASSYGKAYDFALWECSTILYREYWDTLPRLLPRRSRLQIRRTRRSNPQRRPLQQALQHLLSLPLLLLPPLLPQHQRKL